MTMQRWSALFPGQGAQFVGMGRDLIEASPAATDVYRRADQALGMSLTRICLDGPESELTRTDVQQPAIFVTSAAYWAALQERGLSGGWPAWSAGLSLGEYTALYAAGVFSFEDGVKLVRKRGELMQAAATATASAMVSIIGGEIEAVQRLCQDASEGEVLVPANFNCPGQVVISGTASACERALARASNYGVKGVLLKVAGAFHSPLMQSAADQLGDVLKAVVMHAPQFPVVANVTARPHEGSSAVRISLTDQVTHAVRWQESIQWIIAQGVRTFVELGPGRVLTGLMRKIDRSVDVININSARDLDAMESLSPTAP